MTMLVLSFLFARLTSVQSLKLNGHNNEFFPEAQQHDCIRDHGICYDQAGEQVDESELFPVDFVPEFGLADFVKQTVDAKADMLPNTLAPVPAFDKRKTWSTCPKVYIYDLKEPFQDEDLTNSSLNSIFGQHVDGDMYETKQWALAKIVAYRLLNSKACRTLDASEADLFFVPLLAKSKSASHWHTACGKIKGKSQELAQLLPHLNEATAKKHFMLMGKGFYHGWCDGIWRKPDALFQKMARVSVQLLLTPDLREQISEQHSDDMHRLKQQIVDPVTFPRHYTVPYPSEYHGLKFSWNITEPRNILASFVGSTSHGDTAARQTVGKYCGKDGVHCETFQGSLNNANVKQQSTFCLEPVGDALGRKSLVDAYAAGCIPVFFGNGSPLQYPLQYAGWEQDAYVLINRPKFIHKKVDLVEELKSIPNERVVAMRKAINENAHKFIYATDDEQGDDGLSVLLKKLAYDSAN